MSVKFYGDHEIAMRIRYNLATLSLGDSTRFKQMASFAMR